MAVDSVGQADRVLDVDDVNLDSEDDDLPMTAEQVAAEIGDHDDVSEDDDVNDRGEIRLPDDVDYADLDRDTRAGLRSLPKGLAEAVGLRLVAAGQLLDVDPKQALAHALVARRMASRIAVVREAVGVAAYHSEEWQTAISELRTAQRLTGTKSHVAVIADAERALGRPERAVDAYREVSDAADLEPEIRVELLIVAAGARRDLGQGAASVAMLQVPELESGKEPWHERLRYAYADALAAEGRLDEAREWFARVSESDPDDELGANERLLEMDGVSWLAEPEDES
ncbi:tetratricopeptide repeat protein [Stackebrandtia soli]|uniref:tetratricopeptide repeat protein n=1 Tax=Stackebrandtia soli TaxID=1892856 RepID=UPI0039EA7B2D